MTIGHTPRRGAHLLRVDVAVPGAASGCVAVGSARRVSVRVQRDRPAACAGLSQRSRWRRFGAAVKAALKDRGTAAAALGLALATALYGGTGYLEAARRALNVVFEVQRGRSFIRRKLIDVASLLVLLALVLTTLVLVFTAGGVAHRVLGPEAASVWRIARWPGALASALLVFSFIYYVTPDLHQRSFRSVLPGAFAGVAVWLAASAAFSEYLANFKSFDVTYGSFAAAIILLVWLWLTNVALLLGAEINAQIDRVHHPAEGTPELESAQPPACRLTFEAAGAGPCSGPFWSTVPLTRVSHQPRRRAHRHGPS